MYHPEEDLHSYHEKENSATQGKILPALPQKQHFVSNDKEVLNTTAQVTRNILCKNTFFNAISRNGEH